MPAGIYVRLSKDREDQTSTARQEFDCRQMAERLGQVVGPVYADEGRSAYRKGVDRPGLDQALADLQSGTISTLVVWKLDRLSRRGIGQVGAILDGLEAHGGRIVSVMDGVDTAQASGRVVVAVLAEMARGESENISTRVRSAMADARRKGKWPNGSVPYGLRLTPGRTLEPHPDEAQVALSIVESIEAGESMGAVCRRLGADGHRTRGTKRKPQGSTWTVPLLAQYLRAPSLAGFIPEGVGPARDSETREPIMCGEGLITPARWYALQATLQERRRPRGRRPGGKTLLTGVARCGRPGCGAGMVSAGGAEMKLRNYSCGGGSEARCRGLGIRAEPLDRWVASRALSKLAALEPGDPLLDAVAERWVAQYAPADVAGRRKLEEEAAEAEAALRDLEQGRYVRQEFPGPEGLERYGEIHTTLSDLLTLKRQAVADLPPVRPDLGPLLDLELSREAWEVATLEDRRAILGLVVDAVIVEPVGRGRQMDPSERCRIVWAGESAELGPAAE
jgi:site-specific DNA recombinase